MGKEVVTMTFKEQLEKCEREEIRVIADYLLNRNDIADKLDNPKKSLDEMMKYVVGEAKERAKDNWTMIDNETVYGWAVHYYDEENIEVKPVLGITAVSKTVSKTDTSKSVNRKKTKKIEQEVYQMNLFEE